MSIDVEMKNQLFRRISPGWRLFLTRNLFHFYGKQRTVLPRLRVARPAWDLIENLDAIQCDVPKRSSTNSQVNLHPCVFQNTPLSRRPPHKKRKKKKKETGSWFRHGRRETGGEKNVNTRNAQIPARCYGSRAGHPHRVFASILIFIQYFLRAHQWLFSEGRWRAWGRGRGSGGYIRDGCYQKAKMNFGHIFSSTHSRGLIK